MTKKYFQYIDQILNFYNNPEFCIGFNNGFFKEGNSESMVLPRLERATKDEACNDLLHSRYALWASSVNDLMENAIKAIGNRTSDESLIQLQLASNAIKAYKDIQIIFDNDNFYTANDIFNSYASHLLNLDDKLSKIMFENEIKNRLKEYTKVSGIKLPSDINFSIKNGVLRVFINTPAQNMQANGAAFEGWILALKSWLSSEIQFVELDFAQPKDLIGQYGNPQVCHYNRFLYRINNLLRLFPEWFFLHESKKKIVSEFMLWINKGDCLLNHSLKERESVIDTDKMERQIESWFAFEDGKKPICDFLDLDENKFFNQLPIGVFYEEIASNKAVFTRGAGAVDLWGVGKDGQTLNLIELKCGNNINMGVISEVLFYTSVIYDTCVAKDNLFSFGKYGNSSDTKDMLTIKNNGSKFKRLHSHILAERYHPLFNDAVLTLIQDGLLNLDIGFDRATYDYEKKVIIDEPNDL